MHPTSRPSRSAGILECLDGELAYADTRWPFPRRARPPGNYQRAYILHWIRRGRRTRRREHGISSIRGAARTVMVKIRAREVGGRREDSVPGDDLAPTSLRSSEPPYGAWRGVPLMTAVSAEAEASRASTGVGLRPSHLGGEIRSLVDGRHHSSKLPAPNCTPSHAIRGEREIP